jgi:hypothetical protein
MKNTGALFSKYALGRTRQSLLCESTAVDKVPSHAHASIVSVGCGGGGDVKT